MLHMDLSALRTFITLLAILQVCEERRFKIEELYVSDHIGKKFHYT